jgi:hypothetical protein
VFPDATQHIDHNQSRFILFQEGFVRLSKRAEAVFAQVVETREAHP